MEGARRERTMDQFFLSDFICDIDNYEAHILEDDDNKIQKRESLLDHISLTVKYFEKIWEMKHANEMLGRFLEQVCGSMTPEAVSFWGKMVSGIPNFHDIGKINPEFQQKKMKNDRIHAKQIFSCVQTKHSIISAVLYIDYFFDLMKSEVKDREDRNKLRIFIVLHAYIIDRHHSDLGSLTAFLSELQVGQGNDVMEVLKTGACQAYKKSFTLNQKKIKNVSDRFVEKMDDTSREDCIAIYAYIRVLYSVLLASDYYATAEFMKGKPINQDGSLHDIDRWLDIYEEMELVKKIRIYQKTDYPQDVNVLKNTKNINVLRTEILSDAESVLKKNGQETMFYLEAPTGSGKSNTAINLSFQMMKEDRRLNKVFYIYPFNTLVEQNMESLKKIFGGNPAILDKITVVNSLVPIKMTQLKKKEDEESEEALYYQKALLDRQFLNYPMVLSTHVSMFDIMFGDTKESAFGFHQLMNSVIVLDEIQSYKNTIWGEIICFLKEFSHLLNIKIIIMSATLPNLDLLSGNTFQAVPLLQGSERYFSNQCFKNRVSISYELLEKENIEEALFYHVKESAVLGKKIIIEFIKKESAYRFYTRLIETGDIHCAIELMSGDDSLMERSRILNKIKQEESIILVATQVVEAGVDIDMDIGYKNISKLDSEEQFLGRINRSCLRTGIVYFFKLDDGKSIYGEDIRCVREFTLENEEMRQILCNKNFAEYYKRILEVLKRNYNEQAGSGGLERFFLDKVGKLDWSCVKKRMELIAEDRWSMSVFLARVLVDNEGRRIDGAEIWREYADLLKDFTMDYAEKRVKLSRITSQMNCFIYQIKRNYNLHYNDVIGDMFYIENGEQYFENGKLKRQKLQGEVGEFIDFI